MIKSVMALNAKNIPFPTRRMELPFVVCFRKDVPGTESNQGLHILRHLVSSDSDKFKTRKLFTSLER